MLQVICDFCGKEVRPEEDNHYVIKIETFPTQDPNEITEADLDEDHLQAVSEIITEMQGDPDNCPLPEATKFFRYDLCTCCHEKFLRDPLGRTQSLHLDFSNN